jgi:hemolysin activation/secretion protein
LFAGFSNITHAQEGDKQSDKQVAEQKDTKNQDGSETVEEESKRYPVSKLSFSYLNQHPNLPELSPLKSLEVPLKETSWGYDAPETSEGAQSFNLSDILQGQEPVQFSSDAIRVLNNSVVRWFNDRNLISVYVNPDPQDISKSGEDLRSSDQTRLRIVIHVAPVGEVKTIANGDRFGGEQNINLPAHAWIRNQSPIQPGDETTRADLIRQDKLDRYIYFLNRHPGRRVEATLGDAGGGNASLGYRVVEAKPWTLYAQVSNTGSENTDDIQERVGFVHNQLTGADDVLSFDYTTAGFGDDFNDVRGSYERPFFPGSRTSFKVNGFYNEFTSSDVGIFNIDFEAEEWGGGASVVRNVYQSGRWFFDLEGGAEAAQETNTNVTLSTEAEASFVRPFLTASLERSGRTANTTASTTVKHNLDDLAGTEQAEVNGLGRQQAKTDYTVLNARFSQNFFLEPIIYGKSWEDPSTPGTSTLAHEIELSARGQYAFQDRLISNETFIAGGFYTVRGYPESAVSGDRGAVGTFEYRFHVPRVLPVNKDQEPARLLGQPFRLTPKSVYGFPDWDFVLSAFFDYGRTTNNDAQGVTPAQDETLMSTGVGAELLLRQNVRIETAWGYALEDLNNGEAQSGDSEFHFLVQLSY